MKIILKMRMTSIALGSVLFLQFACYGQTSTQTSGAPRATTNSNSAVQTEIAAKSPSPTESHDTVAARSSTTIESSSARAAPGQEPSPSATTSAAPARARPSFFTRWGKAYLADWTGTTATDPNAPKRRGTDAPIPSPPYPASDWPSAEPRKLAHLTIQPTCCRLR